MLKQVLTRALFPDVQAVRGTGHVVISYVFGPKYMTIVCNSLRTHSTSVCTSWGTGRRAKKARLRNQDLEKDMALNHLVPTVSLSHSGTSGSDVLKGYKPDDGPLWRAMKDWGKQMRDTQARNSVSREFRDYLRKAIRNDTTLQRKREDRGC